MARTFKDPLRPNEVLPGHCAPHRPSQGIQGRRKRRRQKSAPHHYSMSSCDSFRRKDWRLFGRRSKKAPAFGAREKIFLNTRATFLKFLALIYFFAFLSLWTQVLGLFGSQGILPVSELLSAVKSQLGTAGYWFFPTLCWFNSSDWFLQILCGGGTVLSLFAILGIAEMPVLFLLWFLYLSMVTVGRDFMSFQWDALLLETGFLAIFFTPLPFIKSSERSKPPTIVLWLFRWLLFRLLFSSGAVKWLSGDPAWHHLTALQFHYQTQPLPTWIAWYAHQLPAVFQKFSGGLMFFIELVVPFTIFMPKKIRRGGFGVLVFFQTLIFITGNYCFFNLLTLAICVLLLEDEAAPRSRWGPWLLAALLFLTSLVQMLHGFGLAPSWTRPILQLERTLSPYRITNNYGLFAVMTTVRNEIILEGSNDRRTWAPYEFKYKPGDVSRRPVFVAPHQPRLDWQMWFAALGHYRDNPWFINFCRRVLEGSPEVLKLLQKNPFPDKPPRYLRAVVYEYRFSDFKSKRRDGAWWTRELKGLYCPVMVR